MLTIYKASAGSGKTFRLVAEYLKLILSDPYAYRHILAVTFTNKATAEMKERILFHLGKMAHGGDSPYLELIGSETDFSLDEIRRRAIVALDNLLFDYNRFSVSTIDKFTQGVLRAFNREIGVNPGYQVELDSDLLVSEAVDRLIATLGERPRLRSWLETFVEDKIRNNQSFTVENDLKSLGKELFRERLQNRLLMLAGFLESKGNDRMYLKMLHALIHSFENNFSNKARALVELFAKEGFSVDDFSNKGSGVAGFLEKAAGGDIPPSIGVRTRQAAADAGAWAAKGHSRNREIVAFAEAVLQPGLLQLINYYDEQYSRYLSAKVILSEWFTAAVLVDLHKEVAALGREKEILPLAGSNLLLKSVIDGNDTPFIYEKTGNTYHHFMLDEFQDTSEMQWENFKPLIANSMANGFENLVVGDVKQSIYRWRNSNWDILDSQVMEDFSGFPVNTRNLDVNYRSSAEIVRFNNAFFRLFLEGISGYPKLSAAPVDFTRRFNRIYSDVHQEVPPLSATGGGFVAIEQLNAVGEEFTEAAMERLVGQVKQLYAHGYSAGDMAILVRKKDQGVQITDHFLRASALPENKELNLRVISGESLLLRSSVAVNFIVALFRHLADKEDPISRALLLHTWKNTIEPSREASQEDPESGQGDSVAWVYEKGSDQEFDRCLAPMVARVENFLFTSGPDELITRISALFGLFNLQGELPFLRTLTDKAAEIKQRLPGDMTGFLQWWDERGRDVAVNVNEEVDAIRLLTIHSAKGLEFKAVLIPFFDWKVIDNTKKNILWCIPGEPPFDQAPLVPVNFADKLASTIFGAEYYNELFSLLVDNLNLVYVAFTRAVSVLWLNVPAKNNNDRIGAFLNLALQGLTGETGFGTSYDQEKGIFTFGELPVAEAQDAVAGPGISGKWQYTEFSGRLRLRTGSDDFMALTGQGVSHKNLGKTVHSILSEIITASDLEPACARALATGMLQPEERETVIGQLRHMVRHPVAGAWFSGKYRVLNETDLLTPGVTLRPDRMMILGDEAIVVDYKSGEVRTDSHRRQVGQYAQTLTGAGFSKVTGYLWYIRENELVEVPDLSLFNQ